MKAPQFSIRERYERRVRQQLSRQRSPKHLKTDAAQREVVLAPAVTRLLRERWLVSA